MYVRTLYTDIMYIYAPRLYIYIYIYIYIHDIYTWGIYIHHGIYTHDVVDAFNIQTCLHTHVHMHILRIRTTKYLLCDVLKNKIYVCMYVCMHACMYVYIYIYICI